MIDFQFLLRDGLRPDAERRVVTGVQPMRADLARSICKPEAAKFAVEEIEIHRLAECREDREPHLRPNDLPWSLYNAPPILQISTAGRRCGPALFSAHFQLR